MISRLLDIIWSFPVLLLGVALGTALALGGLQIGPIVIDGDSLIIPLLIIGVVYVPYMARPLRGQVLALREKEFVEAARAQGLGPIRIMFSEILPNLVVDDHRLLPAHGRQRDPARGGAVVPRRRGAAPDAVVGDDDRRRGRRRSSPAPHQAIVPGTMLVLTVLALNVFGDGVRDAFDPRAKVRVER